MLLPRRQIGDGVIPAMSNHDYDGGNGVDCDPLRLIREAPADRPFVVAQLGQSLDGRIATASGESRWINGEAALDHLHRLRSVVDAVVVGVGTVLADDPMLNVRRVAGTSPARVVIDPNRRMPAEARCLGEDGVTRIIVGREGDPRVRSGCEVVEIASETPELDPALIVAALFERGLKRILIEGGARTVSSFLDAGVVDRLHLLVAPVIIGSGKQGLCLREVKRLAEARRPATVVHRLADGDVLFDCDLRS